MGKRPAQLDIDAYFRIGNGYRNAGFAMAQIETVGVGLLDGRLAVPSFLELPSGWLDSGLVETENESLQRVSLREGLTVFRKNEARLPELLFLVQAGP